MTYCCLIVRESVWARTQGTHKVSRMFCAQNAHTLGESVSERDCARARACAYVCKRCMHAHRCLMVTSKAARMGQPPEIGASKNL